MTLENTETRLQYRVTTDAEGSYQFPGVQPGRYRISAEFRGFESIVSEDVLMNVSSQILVNLHFREMGRINQTVNAEIPPNGAVDATIGNTIQRNQLEDLPSEGRSAAGLFSIQPEVLDTGIQDRDFPDVRGGATAGARSDQNNLVVDGVDANPQQTGKAFTSALPITLESIQEFRFVVSNANVNQGRSSGGQISMITRSGTNQLHGALYEYNRNTVTSANDFFNNSTIPDPLTGKSVSRPKFIRNVFGGSVGGPVLVNRLFYFFNYENSVTRREQPQLRTVPSDSLRNGILQYAGVDGKVHAISSAQLRASDPLGLGPNPAILELLKQYPAGNDPTLGDGDLNFTVYRFNAPLNENKPAYIGRIDFNLSDRQKVFFRGSVAHSREGDLSPQFPGQSAAKILRDNSKGFAISHNIALSPNMVNDFRWGLTRQQNDFTSENTGPGLRLGGIDDVRNFAARNSNHKIPVNNITDDFTVIKSRHTLQFGVNFRNIHNKNVSEDNAFPSYSSNPQQLSGSGRGLNTSNVDPDQVQSFVQAQMALLGIVNQISTTYYVNRDATVFSSGYVPRREFIYDEFEWYAQDQWRAARNLTLTAGLRYSWVAPPYEKNGFEVRPSLDVDKWFAARRDGGALGIPSNANPLLSYVLAGKANHAAPYLNPDKNNFAPRVALAWSPDFENKALQWVFGGSGQSSIRAGGGVYFDRNGGMIPILIDAFGGVGLSTFLEKTGDNGPFDYSTAPRFSGLKNLSSIPLPAVPEAGFPATLEFQAFNSAYMVNPNLRTPYSLVFDLSISRKLPSGFTLEAAYNGRLGRNLLVKEDFATPLLNFKDPKSGQTWIQATRRIADLKRQQTPAEDVPPIPFFENLFLPQDSMNATQFFYSALGDLPDWTTTLHDLDTSPEGITVFGPHTFFQQQFDWLPTWTNAGRSSYHALQIMVRRQLAAKAQVDLNYTFSKSLDNGSSTENQLPIGAGQILNAFEPGQTKAPSDFDVRHQFNANFVVALPFGPNTALGSRLPSLNPLLRDWSLSGLLRWRTGFPFPSSTGNGVYPTNFNNDGPPTLKAGGPAPEIKVTKNAPGGPNIFADPAAAFDAFDFTLSGDSGSRNVLHGPGFFTLDASLQRKFKLGEHQEVQFRAEALNLTNTVNFDGRVDPLVRGGIDFSLFDNSSFGRLKTTAGAPRIMQFGLRFQF